MDSLLFPSLAFGVWMPAVVVLQFFAKVAGGAVWAVIWFPLLPVAQPKEKPND